MPQLYSRRTIRRVTRGIAAAALFVIAWIAYLPGNMGCSDSMWSIPTAVSLVDQFNPDLDEHLPILRARGFVFTQRLHGHFFTIYPLGASIMAAPGVAVLRPLAAAIRSGRPALWPWLDRV